MGATAIEIASEAYRHHNLNEVSSFGAGQEFPYNIARDILNEVIRTMNRLGNYWFTESKTALSYTPGQYTYSFSALAIDPKRVIRIRKETVDHWGELKEINWRDFQRLYRSSDLVTSEPAVWAKYGNELQLNTIPDQDYTLYVYHFKDMPQITEASDTLLVPERDEDVLIDCCYQLLGYKIGRWDYGSAMQAMQVKITPLLANMQQDSGIPAQMPAAF